MKLYPLTTIFLLLSYFCYAQEEVSLTNQTLVSGNTYALIIGISDYKDEKITDLKYAHKDADAFYNFLLSASGGNTPQANIKLLKNKEATVSNIYVAKQWLESVAKKDDLVYFYFAGHGDVENSLYELGFLLAYDTPYQNYLNNAVRIEDFNIMANTLSVTKDVNVYLITDACHSGKLAGSDNRGTNLVGGQLSKVKSKEIRIASCEAEQDSEESDVWGGGRGAFSWHFINGLMGLADNNSDGLVSFQEIKTYVAAKVPEDVAKYRQKEQTPVAEGKTFSTMAIVDKTIQQQTLQIANENIQVSLSATSRGKADVVNISDDMFFFEQIRDYKNEGFLEDNINFENLVSKKNEIIIDTFLWAYDYPDKSAYPDLNNFNGISSDSMEYLLEDFNAFKTKKNGEEIAYFKAQLAATIHNRIQEVINLYLEGDAAELERRRYYGDAFSTYASYIAMAKVAKSLLPQNHPLHHILEVKQFYFEGVILRLKLPTTKDKDKLIDAAILAQNKALKLTPHAAYIQNELGILHLYKKETKKAKDFFTQASVLAPSWSLPLSNLASVDLVLNDIPSAEKNLTKAISLQGDLQNNIILHGMIAEKKSDWLNAEESYRHAIDLNQQYFLPFERLAEVYLQTNQYTDADFLYHEAEERKKGYHFEKGDRTFSSEILALNNTSFSRLDIDTSILLPDDLMAFFCWGMDQYGIKNYKEAERTFRKVIKLDNKDPLVFHYLGKIFYDQQKWKEAEIMFKYAVQYYNNDSLLQIHADSIVNGKHYPYDHDIYYKHYINKSYPEIQNYYFLGTLYESWDHIGEAEYYFNKAIVMSHKSDIGGEMKLYKMLEKQERFVEAEGVIKKIGFKNKNLGINELNQFYRNITTARPTELAWPYKLGQLLHDLSKPKATYEYHDTIVYFPLLGEEVFLDNSNRSWINVEDKYFLSGSSSKTISLENIFIHAAELNISGTDENLPLAPPIIAPRKDGIMYLKTAETLANDDITKADINNKLGDIYQWAGSNKQALPYYQKALQYVQNPDLRMKIIDAALKQYRNSIALEQLTVLNDSNWVNFNHTITLSKLWAHAGKYQKAATLLNANKNIHPYHQSVFDDLAGRNEWLAGKYADAIPYYTNLLKAEPSNKDAMYSLSRIYAKLRNKKMAYSHLQRAISEGFDYGYVINNDQVWAQLKNDTEWKQIIKSIRPKKYPKLQDAEIE